MATSPRSRDSLSTRTTLPSLPLAREALRHATSVDTPADLSQPVCHQDKAPSVNQSQRQRQDRPTRPVPAIFWLWGGHVLATLAWWGGGPQGRRLESHLCILLSYLYFRSTSKKIHHLSATWTGSSASKYRLDSQHHEAWPFFIKK